MIGDLKTKFDWILCDSPAGIERGATLAMRYADEAIIVTNSGSVRRCATPTASSACWISKTVRAERGERVEKHLLVTR